MKSRGLRTPNLDALLEEWAGCTCRSGALDTQLKPFEPFASFSSTTLGAQR